MNLRSRGIGANAALAFGGDALARAGMFVALVVLAHELAVAEFARLGVAMAAVIILTSALDGGIAVVATRDGAARAGLRRELLSAGMRARVPVALCVAATCLGAGVILGQLDLALVVLASALVNAAQVALFAVFRSARTLVGEALAKGICGLSYPLCCAAALMVGQRSATSALLALTVGPAATLPALLVGARPLMTVAPSRLAPLTLLRAAAPFGLVAVATLVYYRAPLLMMGMMSSSTQTASYAAASNIAFGLLMLPAAFATGLLPGLSAESDRARRAALTRRALSLSTALLGGCVLALGLAASWLVPLVYGRAYRGAVPPLEILLVSCLAIGAAGVIGTALIASDRRKTIVLQVVAALALNLAACALAIPRLGADGAALATLVTELASLTMLATAYRRTPSLEQRGAHVVAFPVRRPGLVP